MTTTISSDPLWEARPIPTSGALHYQFGPLALWVRQADSEFILHVKRTPSEELHCEVNESIPPEGAPAVDRFAYDATFEQIQAVPVMPERSLVVRPENPLKILSGQRSRFFVSIPLSVRLRLLGKAPQTLVELPSVVLSNTWFGDTMGGELCFALKTKAKHDLATVTRRRWRAICPVTVVNRSSTNLDLQRLCVQVKHLGCFLGGDFIWTNAIEVTHTSEKEAIDVTFSPGAPDFEPIVGPLSPARDPVRKSFLQRGLGGLRLTGIL